MALVPETRPSLLVRLRDHADAVAWEEFVGIYRQVIVRLALLRGLQLVDAEDLSQRVLLSVSQAIPRWQHDPQRGKFRTWLRRIVRNAAVDFLVGQARERDMGLQRPPGELTADLEQFADARIAEQLELEWRREAFRWAADEIRDEFQCDSWDAFWQTAVEGKSIEDVARRLGKRVGAIYVARSRIVRRLQEKVRELAGEETNENKPIARQPLPQRVDSESRLP